MAPARHRRHSAVLPVGAVAVVSTLALLAGLAWTTVSVGVPAATPSPSASPSATPSTQPTGSNLAFAQPGDVPDPAGIRNVVLILADDLDWSAFDQVPRLKALSAQGVTFTNHVVTDSLCCPSRSSLFRSQYVHNHQVVSNRVESGGGWPTFHALGHENDCLPTWLHAAGVQTALIGKYLNQYPYGDTPATYIPPGWDEWVVPTTQASEYRGYDYTLNDNGELVTYGSKPKDFLGDVLTGKSVDFIRKATSPFFLELSLLNPHTPSPVAPRHLADDPNARVPRTPAFNAQMPNEPQWRAKLPALDFNAETMYDKKWRQRVQSSETVADAYDAVSAALASTGQLDNTLIVLTSDNGFHAGNRRLPGGKRTPYREDTVVPMVMIGPSATAGVSISAVTSTIDLAPTFAQVLHADVPEWADGRSLVPLLARGDLPNWRTGVLSESLGDSQPGDPDYQVFKPPNFHSLRTTQWMYVEYVDGSRELFNLQTDPYEIDNVIDTAPVETVQALQAQLAALTACAGPACRTADALPS